MLRAIREIQPGYIVGENVRGLTNWNGGMVFDQVQADLENEGYEVLPFLLPACAVNAPHRRDRIWFVAHPPSIGTEQRGYDENTKGLRKKFETGNTITHSKRGSSKRQLQQGQGQRKFGGQDITIIANPDSRRQSSKEYRQTESGQPTKTVSIGNWQDFPTQSPIRNGNDGIPTRLDGITFQKWRNESIKGAGNAVVPQVVFQIFKAIQTTLF